MDAAIVIPTYNRLAQLKNTLASLERQDYPLNKFEVVIVSDGSTDGTNEYIETISSPLNIKFEFQDNQGAAAARNKAIQMASAEIIIFIDDDIVAVPQLVTEHIHWHRREGDNIVLIGPMLSPQDHKMSAWVRYEQTVLEQQYPILMSHPYELTPRSFYTGNASIARQHLIDSGGFDPAFRRAEDVELAYRLKDLGLRFQFNQKAVGYHYAERSFTSWMNTPYTYGRNDVIFSYQKNQSWLLPELMSEFHMRHKYNRFMVSLCLDRPVISWAVISMMKYLLFIGVRLNSESIKFLCCSGIFNIRYFQGISDELGNRKIFFDHIHKARQSQKLEGENHVQTI